MEPLPDHTIAKRMIISIGVLLAAVAPLITLIDSVGERFTLIIMAVLAADTLIYAWAYYDSREVDDRLPVVMAVSLILFGIISLCVYFIRSRGVANGVRAFGRAVLLMLMLLLVSASVFQLLDISIAGFSLGPQFLHGIPRT